MCWQLQLERELVQRLPDSTTHRLAGSALRPEWLDGWSDLDLHLELPRSDEALDLFAGYEVWAATEDLSSGRQVLRVVLADGRRVDLVVTGGRVRLTDRAVDNGVRSIAALAAAKLGRGDRLIGLHLALDLMRSCLVQAMLLRDRDQGTTIHRFGSDRDALANEILSLAVGTAGITPRPSIVERAVELYGRWRSELEPDYRPDWSGLHAMIDRGLAGQ